MSDLEKVVSDIIKGIEKAAEETVPVAAQFAKTAALNTTKFKVSDTFRSATNFHPLSKLSGFVSTDKDYAYWLEEGNNQKGDYIYPRTAKALHWKSGGNDVFAKRVKAHGPLTYMGDAADKLDDEIEHIFLNELTKIIGE